MNTNMNTNYYCEITPEITRLAELNQRAATINPDLFEEYDVKRGLRDLNGKGVLVGLTEISDVCSTKMVNGTSVPAPGELYYRGYNVKDIISGLSESSHFGFEESTYLLLFGKLPNREELDFFRGQLAKYRSLPTSFVRDFIMKAPSQDMMNTLARSVLTLYSYDNRAEDISIPNVLRQCLTLISLFTDTRHTVIITTAQAFSSIRPGMNCPRLRPFYIFCARTAATRLWKQSFWIFH